MALLNWISPSTSRAAAAAALSTPAHHLLLTTDRDKRQALFPFIYSIYIFFSIGWGGPVVNRSKWVTALDKRKELHVYIFSSRLMMDWPFAICRLRLNQPETVEHSSNVISL